MQGEHPDPHVPAGKVAGQVPLAGSRAPRGSAVQAFVSSGAGDIIVPALAGEQPDDAVEKLHALKLAPGHRREQASETIAAGLVINTDPPAGRAVSADALVTLIISTGPATATGAQGAGPPPGAGQEDPRGRGLQGWHDAHRILRSFRRRCDHQAGAGRERPQRPGSAVDLIIND